MSKNDYAFDLYFVELCMYIIRVVPERVQIETNQQFYCVTSRLLLQPLAVISGRVREE